MGHRSWVIALAFHPDQGRLVTGDCHGVVHCWSYADAGPRPLWTIQETRHGWVRALAVSPDGNTVSLEDEMGSMLENRMRYETYASILEAQFEQIRTSVQEGR